MTQMSGVNTSTILNLVSRARTASALGPGATSRTLKIYRLPPQPPPPASVPLGPGSSLRRASPTELVRDTIPPVSRARQRFTRTGTSASTPRAASAARICGRERVGGMEVERAIRAARRKACGARGLLRHDHAIQAAADECKRERRRHDAEHGRRRKRSPAALRTAAETRLTSQNGNTGTSRRKSR